MQQQIKRDKLSAPTLVHEKPVKSRKYGEEEKMKGYVSKKTEKQTKKGAQYPDQYFDFQFGQGMIQLGYQQEQQKLILLAKQKNNGEEHGRRLEETTAKTIKHKLTHKNISAAYKDKKTTNSVTALTFPVQTSINKIVNSHEAGLQNEEGKQVALGSVMGKLYSEPEKQVEKALEAKRRAILSHSKEGSEERTVVDRQLEEVRLAKIQKEQYKKTYQTRLKSVVTEIKHQNKHVYTDDFMTYIKKKQLQDETLLSDKDENSDAKDEGVSSGQELQSNIEM